MNENPLLEQQEVDPLTPQDQVDPQEKDTRSENEKELVVDNDHDNQEDFERLQNMVSELLIPLMSPFEDHQVRCKQNRIDVMI